MRRRLVSGQPSIPKPVRYGAAVFAAGILVGVIVTFYVAVRLVSDMPASDEFDAIRRDIRAFEYSLIGWGTKFVASSAAAVAVWYRLYDRYAAHDDGDKLGQSRGDES